MLTQEHDFIFKILLIGHTAVGKSNLLLRFTDGNFYQSFLPTIGVDFKIKTIEHTGSIIKLQMWDTAGQQKFKTITQAYYKGAHGIIIVYDVTDRESFRDVQNWLAEAQRFSPSTTTKLLVANKVDLEKQRLISRDQGQQLANSLGMKYIQTSAKSNINVQQIFLTLTEDIKKSLPKQKPSKIIDKSLLLRKQDTKKKQKSFFSWCPLF